MHLKVILPQRVGQTKEILVWVGIKQRHPMRLLMMRVPPEIAQQRRERLLTEAVEKQKQVSEQALELCDWLLLLTDAPSKRLGKRFKGMLARNERVQVNPCFAIKNLTDAQAW